MPREVRYLASIMYAWIDTPLRLKVRPPEREHQILPLVYRKLVPALKTRNWNFDAVISCKSRLLNKTYTYWILFEKAQLQTESGKTIQLPLGTCKGAGKSLEGAVSDAVECIWKRLQHHAGLSEKNNFVIGEQQ